MHVILPCQYDYCKNAYVHQAVSTAAAAADLQVKKILEIGLGCDMAYGPGASAKVWRELFPDAVVWFAEFNEECVTANQDKMDKAK
jgi:hypothetical protein